VAAAGDDAAGQASGKGEKKGRNNQATHGRSPLLGEIAPPPALSQAGVTRSRPAAQTCFAPGEQEQ
jgi:hypothetical protein